MAQNVETGFIRPVASTDTFEVSTSRVEEWLQRQVNATAAVAKKNGEDVPPVNLTLFTLKASDKFHPFVIMLPEEAMIKRNRGGDDEEMSIFNPEQSQNYSRFLPHVWKIVKSYMYTKDDKKAFRSNEWRRALNLTGTTSQYLSTVVFPRSENKNGSKFTIMLLDPLRVFFAMVKEISNGRNDFQIEILETQRNQGTDYIYKFNKVPTAPSKKKKGKDLANDVERMMLAAARRGTK